MRKTRAVIKLIFLFLLFICFCLKAYSQAETQVGDENFSVFESQNFNTKNLEEELEMGEISQDPVKLLPEESGRRKALPPEEREKLLKEIFNLPESLPEATRQKYTKEQLLQPYPKKPKKPYEIIEKEIKLDLDPTEVPITLEQSLKCAITKNFDIRINDAAKEQEKWAYRKSLTEFLPDFGYDFMLRRLDGEILVGGVVPVETSQTSIRTMFEVRWLLFDGFRRYFDSKIAKQLYEISKLRLEFTRDEILLFTTSQYYDLLQDKLNIIILLKNLQQTQEQLEITKDRFEAGVGTKFDVLRSETEVANSKQNLIEAFQRLKESQVNLANTLGIHVETPLMPVENEPKEKRLILGELDIKRLIGKAIENRPDLKIARINVKTARTERNRVFSEYLPSLNFFAEKGWQGERGLDIPDSGRLRGFRIIGFEFAWILERLGLRAYTNIRELNENIKKVKLEETRAQRDIIEFLLKSYYDTIAAKALIKATKKEVLSANESLRLSVVRLEAGVGIFTDVITAQLRATGSQVKHLNAIVDYNETQAQLLFDMGIIDINTLLNGYKIGNKQRCP